MKYFQLNDSVNLKEIGRKYPQSLRFKTTMGSVQDGSIGFHGRIDKSTFQVPDIELYKTAKPTHLISCAGIPLNKFLIVHDSVLNLFSRFRLSDYQFWQLDVYWKEQILPDYYLFHLSFPCDEDWIDFSQSRFILKNSPNNQPNKDIHFNSFKEWFHHSSSESYVKLGLPHPEEVIMDTKSLQDDMVRSVLWFCGLPGYYVSEELMKAIQQQKLTGMQFVPLMEVDNKIRIKE
jgi:hypothetical protein